MFKWLKRLNPFHTWYRIEQKGDNYHAYRLAFASCIKLGSWSTLDGAKEFVARDKKSRERKVVWEE